MVLGHDKNFQGPMSYVYRTFINTLVQLSNNLEGIN